MNFVNVPDSVANSVIQEAILYGLHMKVQSKTFTRPSYILPVTDASKKLLSPSASTRAVKRGSWQDMFLLMKGTTDDLAYMLATGLENPVINETGIDGTYDARFEVAGGDLVTSVDNRIPSSEKLWGWSLSPAIRRCRLPCSK
jgi:uncharacterized protein (TIGR03435 family)